MRQVEWRGSNEARSSYNRKLHRQNPGLSELVIGTSFAIRYSDFVIQSASLRLILLDQVSPFQSCRGECLEGARISGAVLFKNKKSLLKRGFLSHEKSEHQESVLPVRVDHSFCFGFGFYLLADGHRLLKVFVGFFQIALVFSVLLSRIPLNKRIERFWI